SGKKGLRNQIAVAILDAPNNTIGGTTAGARNVIYDNTSIGIDIFSKEIFSNNATHNLIQGNFIGMNASGNGRLQNIGFGQGVGVRCGSRANTIGGTTTAARNVISGNSIGVSVSGDQTMIQGNFIGTGATGTTALGNSACGVLVPLFFAEGTNTIGGAGAEARNVISANGTGITISSGISCQIQNNFIGTNAAGNAPLGNTASGVFVSAPPTARN